MAAAEAAAVEGPFFLAHTRCFCLPAWYGSLKIYKALLPPSHSNEKAEKEKEKSIEKQGTAIVAAGFNVLGNL